MRRVAAVLACFVAGFAVSLLAQEGHPLTGTWHGEYGPQHVHTSERVPVLSPNFWNSFCGTPARSRIVARMFACGVSCG